MNIEEAKKLLPVIEAFSKGREVEYYNEDLKQWFEISYPTFTGNVKYRVKPEPKYRPFNSREECWDEMLKHAPFGWVIEKLNLEHFNINSVGETGVGGYTYKQAFKELTFADGRLFGIKEE